MNRFASWLKSVLGKKKKYPSCASCEFWCEFWHDENRTYGSCYQSGGVTHRDYACIWMEAKMP